MRGGTYPPRGANLNREPAIPRTGLAEMPRIAENAHMTPRAPRRRRGERGQTVVEVAIALPILLTLLFAIFELGNVYSNKVQVDGAARDGARAAAVSRLTGNGVTAATAAAKASAGDLNPSQLGVSVSSTWVQGSLVTVTVTYPYSVSIYGLPVKSGTLTSTTKMRVE
jgi:Flp pilus assembly protein TadG